MILTPNFIPQNINKERRALKNGLKKLKLRYNAAN